MKANRVGFMMTQDPHIKLRAPKTVMRLARMGSFHQSRLSFMRTLLRRLIRENWRFDRTVFDIDEKGVGLAIYQASGPTQIFSLICFGHDLPDDQRSDRVIAHAWDSTFTLFKGVPTKADIERLRDNVPKQEAGRVSETEVSLSRANRSVRMFDHVVDRLSQGLQPDAKMVSDIGYVMRTTAVYGSGKFGAADHPQGGLPFQQEMLSVFLTRAFTMDLVEHLAKLRAPAKAVKIEPHLRRQFGVGNSTGLGMAPFLINHPALLNNWILARETALGQIRAIKNVETSDFDAFKRHLDAAIENAAAWRSAHEIQIDKINALQLDLATLKEKLQELDLETNYAWDDLYLWVHEHLSLEGQEQFVSLVLEPYAELVDHLTENMGADEAALFPIDGTMKIGQLRSLIEERFDWALEQDWTDPACIARVWYVSEEKLEPRLGERASEPLEPYEQPLAPGRDAALCFQALSEWNQDETVAAFLMAHPEHRQFARRAQILQSHPYAEICDNTIDAKMLPIDLLRCKLSFFGATHFDPRSDRWVRITMFKGAPFPNELHEDQEDNWSYALAALPR